MFEFVAMSLMAFPFTLIISIVVFFFGSRRRKDAAKVNVPQLISAVVIFALVPALLFGGIFSLAYSVTELVSLLQKH